MLPDQTAHVLLTAVHLNLDLAVMVLDGYVPHVLRNVTWTCLQVKRDSISVCVGSPRLRLSATFDGVDTKTK